MRTSEASRLLHRPAEGTSVRTGTAADGQSTWSTATRDLSGELRGAVPRWTGWAERTTAVRRRREPGMARVLVMVQLESPLHVLGGDRPLVVGSFVSGPGPRWTDTLAQGPASGVHVELTPLAARRLLGVPLAALRGRVLPLDDVAPAGWRFLTEQVADAADWCRRLDRVEEALRAGARRSPAPRDEEQLGRAWGALAAGAQVQDAAALAGWSRRHLSRVMRRELGLVPSEVLRLRRFSVARRLLQEAPGSSIADVAVRAGFADQSHLTRECRQIAGVTPSELRRRLVPSVQDGRGDDASA